MQARERKADCVAERAVLLVAGTPRLAHPLQRHPKLISRRGVEREPHTRVVLFPSERVEQPQLGLDERPLLTRSRVIAALQPVGDRTDLVDPMDNCRVDRIALLAWQQDPIAVLACKSQRHHGRLLSVEHRSRATRVASTPQPACGGV